MKSALVLSGVVLCMLLLFFVASPPANPLSEEESSTPEMLSMGNTRRDTIVESTGDESVSSNTNGEVEDAQAAEPSNRSSKPKRPRGRFCNGGVLTNWRPGKCNDDRLWLQPWVNARPGDNWTLVDVGANKGYIIADWLDVLLGYKRTNHTARDLGIEMFGRQLSSELFKSACGGCCECVELPSVTPDENRASNVKIYGFEPSPANYKWLASFFTNTDVVNITHAAVAHKESRSYFPDNPLGVEIGKVRETYAKGYVKVDVVTLDKYLSHLDYIDVLSTDAEGFDQDVAKGAESFLKNGRVGVYQFEMYRDTDDYERIFEELGTYGYICYFATESRPPKMGAGMVKGKMRTRRGPHPPVPTFVRITDCWATQYKKYTGWVNAVCYNTKVPHLEQIFTKLQRTNHRGLTGLCPGRVQQQRHVTDFLRKYVTPKKEENANWRTKM